MAELFKGRVVGAHGFQKPVVIKKILPHLAADATFASMFIDEANITARLDHPKIAQVLELGTIGDQLYIAMEFVDGRDLLALLRAAAERNEALPAPIAVHIAHEVLDALDYAHRITDEDGRALGVVHRDISPSNVLISRRGDVKLADFGIAHAIERRQKTQAGTLKGKYHYMSPEQVIGGDLDCRSDLFSVSIVLAEMLMGRHLFKAANHLDVLLMVRDVRLERLEKYGGEIDPELRAIVLKSLQRDPTVRHPTAGAYRDALAEWLFSHRQRVTPMDLASYVEHHPELGNGSAVTSAGGPSTQGQASLSPEPSASIGPPVLPSNDPSAEMVIPQGGIEDLPTGDITPETLYPSEPHLPVVSVSDGEDRPRLVEPVTAHGAALDSGVVSSARHEEDSEKIVIIEPSASPPRITGPSGTPVLAQPWAGRQRDAPRRDIKMSRPDFADLQSDSPPRPSKIALRSTVGLVPQERPAAPSSPNLGVITEAADEEGDLVAVPPTRLLYKLAVEKESGLLVIEVSAIVKEVYLVEGAPEHVSSNVAREFLGEYLLSQKVISDGELSMALAMMPHFGGKLGDTLVGLGLLKPLDVFRHLTRLVREKVLDVLSWPKGKYRFYRGKQNSRESFPLGLDAFEILGAGAQALPQELVVAWARPLLGKAPAAAPNPRLVPEAFRLGEAPRDVFQHLEGNTPLREILAKMTKPEERLTFLRLLYLLVHTDLAVLA